MVMIEALQHELYSVFFLVSGFHVVILLTGDFDEYFAKKWIYKP